MNEENKNYEVSFLVKADQDKDDIAKILKEGGFSIINAGQTARIKLTFPVKKENFAYFGSLYFSGNPADIQGLSQKLKTDPKILRFSVIFKPVIKESEGRISEGAYLTRSKPTVEHKKIQEISSEPFSQPVKKPARTEALSNEALEKRLEEILK